MKVRQLIAQDAEQYLNIRLEALQKAPEAFASSYEEEKNLSANKYMNRFQSPENSITFGAFIGNELVGIVTLLKETKLKLQHRANIVAMYVKQEKREQGIGKALLTEAVQRGKDTEGIEQIYLSVVTTNEAAKQLYASFNFEVFGTENNALKHNNVYFHENHMVLFV